MQKSFVVPMLILAAGINGCSSTPVNDTVSKLAYKIDIQQGNVITQDMVAKLHAGMTQAQVRYILGTALVTDPFHPERWDYVYTYAKSGKVTDRKRLTVIFVDNKLAKLEGDVTLDAASLAPGEAGPVADVPVNQPLAAPAVEPAQARPLSASEPPPQPVVAAPVPAAAPDAKQAEAKKDDKGFFGRMLDKIGF